MDRLQMLILCFVFGLSACHSSDDKTAATENDTVANMKLATDTNLISEAIDSSHTAKNSADWKGSYKGIVPCADCAGVETSIMLHGDGTYMMSRKYLGKYDNKVQDNKGSFVWLDGSRIELQGMKYVIPPKYLVTEGKLIQLDVDGNMVKDENAEEFILNKTK